MSDAAQNPKSGGPAQQCPNCQHETDTLIAGVCPRCKKTFASVHAKVLRTVTTAGSQREEDKAGAASTGGRPAGTFAESGERILTTADEHGGDEIVHQFCEMFAVNHTDGIEMVAFVAQNLGGTVDAEAVRKNNDLIERTFLLRDEYIKRGGHPVLADRCAWLLLGFKSIAGADNQRDLARLLNVKKQTLNKCLKHYQLHLPELPQLENQRDDAARDNMKQAQKQIWAGGAKQRNRANHL